jgi:hypothetical protein
MDSLYGISAEIHAEWCKKWGFDRSARQVVLHQGPELRRVEVPWVDLAILNDM